jgi:hypothetical protein
MVGKSVQIEAKTYSIIHPTRALHVKLQLSADFDCHWFVQISRPDGYVTHQMRLPDIPKGLVWTVQEWLESRQTIAIYASSHRDTDEDFISFQVNGDATRLVMDSRDNEMEPIDFQATVADPPPLKQRMAM